MDELHRYDHTLNSKFHKIRQNLQESSPLEELKILDPNHSQTRYEEHMSLRDSNPPPWPSSIGVVTSMSMSPPSTHMAIIWALNSHKCKLLFGIFRDAALQWVYIMPPLQVMRRWWRNLYTSSSPTIPGRYPLPSYLTYRMRDYLTRFNYSTIRFIPPNQEMFVWAF